MPLYEYRCESCNARLELLVQGKQVPTCAQCGGRRLKKLFSTFAVSAPSSRASASPSPSPMMGGCGTCGDPRGPGSCKTDG